MATFDVLDRRFATYRRQLATPVPNGGTVSFSYGAGQSPLDFADVGHKIVTTLVGVLSAAEGHFSVAIGSTAATVTNNSGMAWPVGMRLILELNLLGNTETPLSVEDGGTGQRRRDLARNAFPSRATAVTMAGLGWTPANGEDYLIEGFWYRGSAGATAIADLPGLVPAKPYVSPQHFGGVTGAAVAAAWAYYQTIMGTGAAASQAATAGYAFYFPPALYNSGGSLVTLTTAGFGQVVFGDCRASRLNNINFVVADGGVTLRDFDIEGLGKTADGITWTPRAANIRRGTVSDVRIRGALYGLRTIDDANVAWIRLDRVYCEGCVTGARFDRVIGFSPSDCQFSSNDEYGFVLYRGGELRMMGCRCNGNGKAGLRLDGKFRGQVVVENYIHGGSFGGNYAIDANKLTWPITAAADNGSGGTRLTLDVSGGRHHFSTGLIRINVSGTTSYNGDHVVNAVTDTTVDIAVPFAGSQTGTIRDYGYDVEVVGDAALRPGQVNDLWFIGSNINNFYAKDCVNITFVGTRLKQRAFLDDGCSGIARFSSSRGRLNSSLDEESDEGTELGSWSPVEFTGQNYGFAEEVSIFGSGWTDFDGIVKRAPNNTVALIGNKVQSYHSSQVDENGVRLTGVTHLTGSVVAASAVDTTIGRLWVNGSTAGMFGWGGAIAGDVAISNLDSLTLRSGIYGTTAAATTTGTWPPGESASTGVLLVMNRVSNATIQMFWRTSAQERGWYRFYQGSAWSQWRALPGTYITSIASAPSYVGQEALVSGLWYDAVGTASAADWKYRSGYLTSIAAAPPAVGALALSGGALYIAKGTSGPGDWKALN